MKVILVTGANKGIGKAIVTCLLRDYPDTHLLLGSRDVARGESAVAEISSLLGPSTTQGRLELLQLDVSSQDSVDRAVKWVKDKFGTATPMYGLINNAGGILDSVRQTLELNTFGLRRVCEAFLPLIQADGGRIVQVSSASGPNYVATCSTEVQAWLAGREITWAQIQDKLIKPSLSIVENSELSDEEKKSSLASLGLGEAGMAGYGLSKAAVNGYTVELSNRYPALFINSCTPGFIETDLTQLWVSQSGKSPAEMGMKSPEAGAACPVYLAMADLAATIPGYQSGRFYGSDCLRSPVHKYRSPGTEPYTGEFP